MCEQLLANPLIEDYEIVDGTSVKFGVVRFPGSCDERRRAAAPRARSARPSSSGTATATCRASTRSIVPGGFSYGDYLRVGAIARFAPVMEAVERFARDGGPVLGHLQRLPGAVRGRPAAGRAAAEHVAALHLPPGRARGRERATRRGPRACEPGELLSIPAKHTTGRYWAPDAGARRARGQRPGRAALRAGAQLQRLGARHRRRLQRRGQRRRADAAPRARGRRADRLGRRPEAVRVAAPCRTSERPRRGSRSTVELGPHRRRVRADRREARPRAERGRARHVLACMWSEHCGYKHSRRLLRTLPTEGAHLVMGPGENAGAVDVGDGLAVRVQGRVAQPPERGRAVPGRGDRRRRHPARHLRDRRAADRDARLAALRRAVDSRALALPARARGGRASATTATRSACRPSAARSTSRARTSRTASSTRWRSG